MIRSHLRKHLVPHFGRYQMRDIGPEEVQRFVSSVDLEAKTVNNLFATMQMLWKSARSWGCVTHDAVSNIVLPKRHRKQQRFFSVEEIQRLLESAEEPYRTFYWLAAETAIRAGELCGLRRSDFDFGRGLVRVNRSVWRGRVKSTKSEHLDRCFALSSELLSHIAEYLRRWTPNEAGWLFATRNGTPWDQSLVVKRKLYPLLDSMESNGEASMHFAMETSRLTLRPPKISVLYGVLDASWTLDMPRVQHQYHLVILVVHWS
jgi:integrase